MIIQGGNGEQYIDPENLNIACALPSRAFWLPDLLFADHVSCLPNYIAVEYANFFMRSYDKKLSEFAGKCQANELIHCVSLEILKNRQEAMALYLSRLEECSQNSVLPNHDVSQKI